MVRSLAPCLLLSMPQLVDPNFSRTVVLLCWHREQGAFGLVLNRRLATNDPNLEVWLGGPVEPELSWILVAGPDDEAPPRTRVAEGISLSRSPDLFQRLLEPDPPPNTRLIFGYSGWGPGQLEAELEASAWLIAEVDPQLIFHTPADNMWEMAMRGLGVDPAALHMSRGVH
jgi:putative transcriptional regulator